MLFCLKKSHIDVAGMNTAVSGTVVRNEKGRFRIDDVRVTLAPDVAAADQDRMSRCLEIFEDFCIVTASVREGIPVTVEVQPQAEVAGDR